MNPSIQNLLQQGRERLSESSESPRLDSEVLLGHLIDRNRAWLYANPDELLTTEQQAGYERLLEKRASNVPVAHLIGAWEFWSLELEVTADVLVPRPETELLVELALKHIPAAAECSVVDLGTGSGVLAIAAAMQGATVHAVDLDPAADSAVHGNAQANGVADRITVTIADIADIESGPVDVVLLNVTIDIHEAVAATVQTIDADRLVIAGVLAGEQAERAARLHGRTATDTLLDGEWAAVVFDRGGERDPS